jgi:PPOX class probable F420-dependent enzyme
LSPTARSGALTAEELDELLRQPLLARLATVSIDGFPSIAPVWHEWDGAVFWLVLRAAGRLVEDIRRDDRVGLSIVDDSNVDRRVQVRGRASIVEGPGPLEGRLLELARRMAERYEGPSGLEYVERSASWPRVLVRIDPVQVVTWGSPDWHHRYKPDPVEGPS